MICRNFMESIILDGSRVSTENRKSKIFEIFDVRKYFEPFEKNLRNFEFSRNFRRKFFGFVRKFSTKISKIFENLFEKIKNAQNRLIRWENRKKNFSFWTKNRRKNLSCSEYTGCQLKIRSFGIDTFLLTLLF